MPVLPPAAVATGAAQTLGTVARSPCRAAPPRSHISPPTGGPGHWWIVSVYLSAVILVVSYVRPDVLG